MYEQINLILIIIIMSSIADLVRFSSHVTLRYIDWIESDRSPDCFGFLNSKRQSHTKVIGNLYDPLFSSVRKINFEIFVKTFKARATSFF